MPSRSFNYFCGLCSVVALLALLYSGAIGILQVSMLGVWAALTLSLLFPKRSVLQVVWDLDRSSMSLLCKSRGWVVGERIEKIHLLPGLCFFKVKPVSGKSIFVCVFPDSVSKNEYRRLRVALRLGKMPLAVTEAIQS
ncbi:protein YgfX [Neptunomonas japonica]|uniref:protein YgfX n=1 Tax=Neptunomonas japonica TaxID=417574 RepID=UPI0012EC81EC